MDPLTKKYPYLTPYQFSSNQPIHAPELEGLESGNELGGYSSDQEGENQMLADVTADFLAIVDGFFEAIDEFTRTSSKIYDKIDVVKTSLGPGSSFETYNEPSVTTTSTTNLGKMSDCPSCYTDPETGYVTNITNTDTKFDLQAKAKLSTTQVVRGIEVSNSLTFAHSIITGENTLTSTTTAGLGGVGLFGEAKVNFTNESVTVGTGFQVTGNVSEEAGKVRFRTGFERTYK